MYYSRILTLHDVQSNNKVTKLELKNLEITSEENNILYLHRQIKTKAYSDLEVLFTGLFYSWFNSKDNDKFRPSVIDAVKDVVDAMNHHSTFDSIYSFSTGAIIASLTANLTKDSWLQGLLHSCLSRKHFSKFEISIPQQITKILFKCIILAYATLDITLIRKNTSFTEEF